MPRNLTSVKLNNCQLPRPISQYQPRNVHTFPARHSIPPLQFQPRTASLRVFDEISFRENFAKLATKRFSCFAIIRHEFRSFAKLPRLRKKRVSRKRRKLEVKIQNLMIFLSILVKMPAKVVFGNGNQNRWALLTQNLTSLLLKH